MALTELSALTGGIFASVSLSNSWFVVLVLIISIATFLLEKFRHKYSPMTIVTIIFIFKILLFPSGTSQEISEIISAGKPFSLILFYTLGESLLPLGIALLGMAGHLRKRKQ